MNNETRQRSVITALAPPAPKGTEVRRICLGEGSWMEVTVVHDGFGSSITTVVLDPDTEACANKRHDAIDKKLSQYLKKKQNLISARADKEEE